MKKKLVTIGLVATLAFSGFIHPSYTYAEQSLKEIREERSEIKGELSKAEKEIVTIMDEIKGINMELSVLQEALEENERAVVEVEGELKVVQKEIDVLEERIEERFIILGDRAKSYQETGGSISYLDVVLGAKSFTEFISRVHAITQITDSDAEIIEEQVKEQNIVKEKLIELEDLQAELKNMEKLIVDQQESAKEMKTTLDDKQNKLKNSMEKLKKKDRSLAEKEAKLFSSSNKTVIKTSNSNAILDWPTAGGYISSTFGKRWGKLHKGIDIARTNRSTSPPIFAAESGTIEKAGNTGNGYGNMIVIDHGDGLKTLYAHLSSLDVKAGQKIERGEKLGIMGATGNSTGIHLHFEVHEKGQPINPIPFLR